MSYQTLLTEIHQEILTITINRPDKMNALNSVVIRELDKEFDLARDNDAVRGIIITGAGNKAFIAGADIAELANYTTEQAKAMSGVGQDILDRIETCPKPVIAAVNGFALGGGLELAMACHIRIASDTAKFGQPEINLGIIPGYGGTQRLPRYIGKSRALELLLTGDMISAQDALTFGLVNYVTTADELLPKAKSILEKIKTKSPLTVDQIIACVNSYYNKNEDGFELEIDEFGRCFITEDFKEGTTAFLEKRKAEFQGK